MPTIEQNLAEFTTDYDWSGRGDEWSEPWGGTDWQWRGTLWPRIHRFVPAGTILEIAPGFGRWSQFLKELCKRLYLVDLSEKCVDACEERFRADAHVECFLNDGTSLDMVPSHSVDFVFSFDSLVHADADAVEAYVSQLPRVLSAEGVAFLHHSNLGEYAAHFTLIERLPLGTGVLRRLGLLDTCAQWRSYDMTAVKLRRFAETSGLSCVSQELVNWKTRRLIDCMSVVTRPGSRWDGPPRIVRNDGFMEEAARVAAIAGLYGPTGKGASENGGGQDGEEKKAHRQDP